MRIRIKVHRPRSPILPAALSRPVCTRTRGSCHQQGNKELIQRLRLSFSLDCCVSLPNTPPPPSPAERSLHQRKRNSSVEARNAPFLPQRLQSLLRRPAVFVLRRQQSKHRSIPKGVGSCEAPPDMYDTVSHKMHGIFHLSFCLVRQKQQTSEPGHDL